MHRRSMVGIIGLLVLLRGLCWWLAVADPPACIDAAEHELALELLSVKQANRDQGAAALMLDARVRQVLNASCESLTGTRVRLSWYSPAAAPAPGDLLQAQVRLRKPWGARNPGGFDYGLWLLGQGYAASGYIRSAEPLTGAPQQRPRLRIADDAYVHGGLLSAIALGVRDGVRPQTWALFRATGTVHLMVISGLHVGVFAGAVFLALRLILRLLTCLPPAWPPRQLALLGSLTAVAGLVYQTGMQAPVLRASLMSGMVVVLALTSRRVEWQRGLCAAALLSLLLAPRLVLQQGFWLSYAAVWTLLLFFAPRLPQSSWVRGFVCCQGVLLLGLTPWLGRIAGDVPLVGPLANLLVVPLMSLLTIPVAMAGAALSAWAPMHKLGEVFLLLADVSLAPVLYVLRALQTVPGSLGYFSVPQALQAGVAAMCLLLPMAWRWRFAIGGCWLVLFIPVSAQVPPGEFRLIVLDVGQGSAAIVDTATRRLVVDAGPAYASGFDSGEALVIPALRSTGPDTLQRLLISHADVDHAGGATALLTRYPEAALMGLHRPCRHGAGWRWDGVEFRLLAAATAATRNDASCTLSVSNGKRRLYLSGDIGRSVEQRFLPLLPRRIDLLVAPHHGSSTSSSMAFVKHLCPRFVVFSAALDNRYGHPRRAVVARYEWIGAASFMTGTSGAVFWRSWLPDVIHSMRQGRFRKRADAGSCPQRRSSGESR